MRVQAIINPISGVGSKRAIPKLIEKMGKENADEVLISFTEYVGHASVLTQDAIRSGAECIIAVGGDGTVNEVARAMLYSNAVLGIIPKGSGNGLARELHIPMDVQRALNVIHDRHITSIDCCRANDRVFFCTCGVGFDAAVSQKFAHEKRRGSLTYIKNTIEEYLSYHPEQYELIIDGQEMREKAFLVACANASQYGNNAYIAPHANIQDGEIDITILSPFLPIDIAPLAIQLFARKIDRNSKIKTMKAKQVSIIRSKPGVMHLDGEPVMADSRIDVSVIPRALNVYTPSKISIRQEVRYLLDEVAHFLSAGCLIFQLSKFYNGNGIWKEKVRERVYCEL